MGCLTSRGGRVIAYGYRIKAVCESGPQVVCTQTKLRGILALAVTPPLSTDSRSHRSPRVNSILLSVVQKIRITSVLVWKTPGSCNHFTPIKRTQAKHSIVLSSRLQTRLTGGGFCHEHPRTLPSESLRGSLDVRFVLVTFLCCCGKHHDQTGGGGGEERGHFIFHVTVLH